MLNIKNYSNQIEKLHNEGKTALEIATILKFKYPQPVYNFFKKKGWKNLDRKDYPRGNKYNANQTFFNSIDSEAKAYILGFICADGHVEAKNYRITIALQDSDYLLLDKIRKAMGSNHPIHRHIKRKNPYTKSNHLVLEQCTISINGKELVKPLIKMGLSFKKTYTLDGKIMDYVPKKLWKHFLRGYLDGDGCITWGKEYSSGKKYMVQVCGNRRFLENSYQLFYKSDCAIYKYKTSKQCCTWKLTDKKKCLEFLNFLYGEATIYLNRKYNTYKYAMWSFKTELIAGNSYFIELLKGQSAANPLVKCLGQVQRLADETIVNPFLPVEYNSAKNAQQLLGLPIS